MKKIIIPIILIMLCTTIVFAAVNIKGTIVYPDKIMQDPGVDVVLKEGNSLSFFLKNLFGTQALYPSKNSYKLGENVILQSEFDTWNVKCSAVSAVFEVYKPSGALLTAVTKSWNAQTGTQYVNAQATISASKFTEIGIYKAVVYAKCNNFAVIFHSNNPVYVMTNYPIISTPGISETTFEIIAKDATACIPTNDHDHTKCYNDNIYWYNECGSLTAIKQGCTLGCKDDTTCKTTVTPQCSTSNPCQSGYDCVSGTCQISPPPTQCSTSTPCQSGYECISGMCKAIPLPPTQCSTSNPCAIGYKCVNNVCEIIPPVSCSTSNPCQSGYDCVSGTCQISPPLDYVKLEIKSINVLESAGSLEVRPSDTIQAEVTVANTGTKDLSFVTAAESKYRLEIAAYPDEYLIEQNVMNITEANPFFASIFGFEKEPQSCGGETWVTTYKIYDLPKGQQKTITVDIKIPSLTDKFASGKSAWDYNPAQVTYNNKTRPIFGHQVVGFIYEGCIDSQRDVNTVPGATCISPSGTTCDAVTHDAFKGPNSNIMILRTCGEMGGIKTCLNATPYCLDAEKAIDTDSCCMQCGTTKNIPCADFPGVTNCSKEKPNCLRVVQASDVDWCCTNCIKSNEGGQLSLTKKEWSAATDQEIFDSICTRDAQCQLKDGFDVECITDSKIKKTNVEAAYTVWESKTYWEKMKDSGLGLFDNTIFSCKTDMLSLLVTVFTKNWLSGQCVLNENKIPDGTCRATIKGGEGIWATYLGWFAFAGDYDTVVAIGLPVFVFLIIVFAGRKKA